MGFPASSGSGRGCRMTLQWGLQCTAVLGVAGLMGFPVCIAVAAPAMQAGHGQPGHHPEALPALPQGRHRDGAPAGVGACTLCAHAPFAQCCKSALALLHQAAFAMLQPWPWKKCCRGLPSSWALQDAGQSLSAIFASSRRQLVCAQVLLFSATLHSDEVKSIAARICRNPILVDLKVPILALSSLVQIRSSPSARLHAAYMLSNTPSSTGPGTDTAIAWLRRPSRAPGDVV